MQSGLVARVTPSLISPIVEAPTRTRVRDTALSRRRSCRGDPVRTVTIAFLVRNRRGTHDCYDDKQLNVL